MVYCCSWGLCKSSSRKNEPDVRFVRFPNVKKQRKRAEKWALLCGRVGFTVENVTRHRYICSKHFPPNSILDPNQNPSLEPFNAIKEYKSLVKGKKMRLLSKKRKHDFEKLNLGSYLKDKKRREERQNDQNLDPLSLSEYRQKLAKSSEGESSIQNKHMCGSVKSVCVKKESRVDFEDDFESCSEMAEYSLKPELEFAIHEHGETSSFEFIDVNQLNI